MLVLTRKSMQHIQIGDDIVVTVVEVRGHKVRLGIDAPKEIPIRRSELKDVNPRSPTDVVPVVVASAET
jgi:carbon storage regulator